ncbi:Phosphomevalonate kinase [Trichinella pseudospiralis]
MTCPVQLFVVVIILCPFDTHDGCFQEKSSSSPSCGYRSRFGEAENGGRVAVFLVHISNPLKQEYAKLKGLDYEQLSGSSNRKELYRKEMVKWGEAVRNQDPEYFCRQAVEDVEERSQDVTDGVMWIICDCRRPTDLAYFKRYYGSLSDCFLCKLRIEASESIRKQRGWTFCTGVDDAETECALDAGVEWDFIIENNEENDVISRIEQLATRVLNATAPMLCSFIEK